MVKENHQRLEEKSNFSLIVGILAFLGAVLTAVSAFGIISIIIMAIVAIVLVWLFYKLLFN